MTLHKINMTISWMTCDICGRESSHYEDTNNDRMREIMIESGWKRVKGQDLCRDCLRKIAEGDDATNKTD